MRRLKAPEYGELDHLCTATRQLPHTQGRKKRVPKTFESVESPEVADEECTQLFRHIMHETLIRSSRVLQRTAQDMTLQTQKAVAEMWVMMVDLARSGG